MNVAADKNNGGTALLLVNGDCDSAVLELCKQQYQQNYRKNRASLLVAVDGGLRHCLALGLQPDVLIGDLDSAVGKDIERLNEAHTKILRHNPDKDQTDLELAMEYLQECGIEHVVLAGLSGGRTDQMLCNWFLLGQNLHGRNRWRFMIDVIDSAGSGFVVTADRHRRIAAQSGATISLLALTASVQGLTTEGLHYPLSDAELLLGSSLGISNLAVGSEFSVQVTQGILLAYVNHII